MIVIVKVGAYESPENGFVPTIQIEEHDLPRITFIPFHFSAESVKPTQEEAILCAENEALHILSERYPQGTKYKIEREDD